MTETIDARGLKCPEPAIRTGQALKEFNDVIVIVDDRTAIQNISGAVKKRGYEVSVRQDGEDYYLHVTRTGSATPEGIETDISCAPLGETVIFIASDKVGQGDDGLGAILTRAMVYSFTQVDPLPDAMIFMNSGVKLTIPDSEVLDDLIKLSDAGVKIVVCGTCLDYFGIKEKLAVGEVSNAYTIAEIMLEAAKVIRL